jgi:outer membrane protein TolC
MGLSSIFPWSKQKAEVEKSVIEIDRMKTELQALRSNVSLKVEKLFLDLSREIAKVDAGIKSVELAEELFKSSKEMYENGLISSMEYADAQIGLDESRMGYLTSIYDYRMSLCNLMDVIGADHL